jgi:GT2 family glycosyltransferase
MSNKLVSVIIPAYNAAATIAGCVTALQRQAYDGHYEIIVIDDGSTDGTAQVACDAGAQVITTQRGRPAAARNAGIRWAKGAIICCTDADCVPHSDWLAQITAPFADPKVAACKGSYATRQRKIVARFVQLEYEDKYDLLRSQQTIDFIDTYSAAYRRDVLLANGGFDERFDYLEDQELSFRLAARGCRMEFREAAVVDHLHSSTLAAYLRKKALIGYWKAQVVRRFPERAVKDSHTPQVMKAQMLLATFLAATLVIGGLVAVAGVGRWGISALYALSPALVAAVAFLATTIPFTRKAWRKDRPVALAAPFLLLGRALALSVGSAWGLLRPRRNLDGWPASMA